MIPVLSIEPGGRIVRGLALPYGSGAYVIEDDGDIVEEMMDEQSLDQLPGAVPLLQSHRRDVPALGVVRHWAVIPGKGLGAEAELVVSDPELDAWHRRFKHGLTSGLSVGFRYDKRRTQWERPTRAGDPPRKRPRGVAIEELSLVEWPAYTSAGVTAAAQRGANDQHRHAESERIIREWEQGRAEWAHKQRMRAQSRR